MLMQTWPYFQARESRRALLANVAVPVRSCWNGMGKLVSVIETDRELDSKLLGQFSPHGSIR